jgi:membrane-bound ClpP family serine protease
MPTRITTPVSGASLLLAAAIVACLISPPSAHSAPEVKVENKALADAVKGAMDNAKAGRFSEALAKAKEANRLVDLAEPKLTELPL